MATAENDFPEYILRECVRQMYPRIVASFDPRGYILDSLFAKGTITKDEKQQIERLPERKSAELVDLLYSCRRPNAFAQFLEILSDDENTSCKWIFDEIRDVAHKKVGSTATLKPLLKNKRSATPLVTTADDAYEFILKQCLQQMYSTIVAGFDPKGYILDSLFAKGTISVQEKQQLERLPDRKSAELVSVLLASRKPQAISQFLEILSNEPAWKWISDNVHTAAKEKLASSNASSSESERHPGMMSQDREDSPSSQTDNC